MTWDWTFGSLESRHLCLRCIVPIWFCRWHNNEWRMSPLQLLNPVAWFRAARNKWNWELHCCRHRDCTHRCYCPTGSMIDGRLILCGFGVIWFYSHFTGTVPCHCDKVIAELFPEGEE